MSKIEIPPLADGETYVGCTGDAEGNLHHVILLPGDNDGADWQSQIEWAKSIGGDLPNHTESGWAWYQSFYYGEQSTIHKLNALRARAVRRVIVK